MMHYKYLGVILLPKLVCGYILVPGICQEFTVVFNFRICLMKQAQKLNLALKSPLHLVFLRSLEIMLKRYVNRHFDNKILGERGAWLFHKYMELKELTILPQ